MRREKVLISTALAGAALALVTACFSAAPAYGAHRATGQAPAATSIDSCPQSPTPFMVDGTAADPAPVGEPAGALLPDGASPEVTCVPPTIGSFAAAPNPVDYGGSVTLSWSASSPNPLSCNVSSSIGGSSGGASGSWTIGPITSPTYFELHCWDVYGDGNTAGLTVGVNGGGGGSSSSLPTGWLDLVSSGGLVSGWSCDADDYGASIYVHVYVDGAFVAQVPANVNRPDVAAASWACNGTGNHGFNYQLPGYLLNGQQHTIRVYGINVDAAGGVVGSGNVELSGSPKAVLLTTGDRTPPTVAITAPADGTVVTGSVQVTVGAADNVGVAGVQLQVDGQNLGPELTAAPYSTVWNPSGLPNGQHVLSAVARDAAGNRAMAAVTVVVSDSVTDGVGDEETSGSISASLQRILASTGWCSGKHEMWGPAAAPHIQYRNRFTSLLYWKASASLDVCIDTGHHVIVGFGHERVAPLYTLPVVWHYDNGPVWSFGPTGTKASFSWAQVTDSFTGCPWAIPIGCNKVSFTVLFNVAATGVYSYTVKFH